MGGRRLCSEACGEATRAIGEAELVLAVRLQEGVPERVLLSAGARRRRATCNTTHGGTPYGLVHKLIHERRDARLSFEQKLPRPIP